MTKLQKLKEIAESATPGPWWSDDHYIWDKNTKMIADQHVITGQTRARGLGNGIPYEKRELNLKHIATFNPYTVLKLLQAIELFRLDRYKDAEKLLKEIEVPNE